MVNIFTPAPMDVSLIALTRIFGSMYGIIFPIDQLIGQLTGLVANIPTIGPTLAQAVQALPVGDVTLLSQMFKYFNSAVLAVGTLVVIYTTIVSVIATAHEGKLFGKHFSSLWVPLRTVFGIAALVPTSIGYSAIQIVFMWVIVQGIGMADNLWGSTLYAISSLGGIGAQQSLPQLDANVNSQFQNLFQMISCDVTTRSKYNLGAGSPYKYYCATNPGDKACTDINPPVINTSTKTYSFGPQGACGTLTLCDVKAVCVVGASAGCATCEAQYNVMQATINAFYDVAKHFNDTDYQYLNFYMNSHDLTKNVQNNVDWAWIGNYCSAQNPPVNLSDCCVGLPSEKGIAGKCQSNFVFPAPNDAGRAENASKDAVENFYKLYQFNDPVYFDQTKGQDFIDTAVANYGDVMTKAINSGGNINDGSNSIGDLFKSGKNALSTDLIMMNSLGWSTAGSFYYWLSVRTNLYITGQNPDLQASLGNQVSAQGPLAGFRSNDKAAGRLIGASIGGEDLSTGKVTDQVNEQLRPFLKIIKDPKNWKGITGNVLQILTNPIIIITNIGQLLLAIIPGLFNIVTGIIMALGMTNIGLTAVGTGVTQLPIGPTLTTMMIFLAPILFAMFATLLVVGGTLGVYIPLIPFIVFSMGVLGWFMGVIEAIIAAPLVALAMLSPSGEGVFGKAEQAVMMLFGVFLRPSLMLFGLFAATLLSNVALVLISFGFLGAYVGIGITTVGVSMLSILSVALFFLAYCYLILSVVQKCYNLVYLIPQQVGAWIGIGKMAGDAGEAGEQLQTAKGGITKGAGQASAPGQKIGGAAVDAAKKQVGANLGKAKAAQDASRPGGGVSGGET